MIPPRQMLTSENTRDGIPSWAQWRANDEAQVALSRLAAAVDQRFGDTEEDPWIQLRSGFIGIAPNDEDHTVYAVVDLPEAERAALERDLQGAAGDSIVVRTHQGCNSAAGLLAQAELLTSTRSLSEVSAYVGDVDPNTATISLGVYPEAAGAIGIIRKAIDPAFVTITELAERPTRDSGGRTADAQPHWGGARIHIGPGGYCSSGFAIDTASAGKAFVSAGHCGVVGNNVSSGTHGWGSVTRRGNFPARDMLVINASNQNYDDDIYMNPIWSVNDPIDVGGTRVVSAGNHVCISGATSHTSCNLEVAGVNAFFCDNPTGACTENLVRYNQGEGACDSGDSGAPVFSQWGTPVYARIVGMHIGRGSQSAQGAPNGCLAHKFRTIENTFDVTVATNP